MSSTIAAPISGHIRPIRPPAAASRAWRQIVPSSEIRTEIDSTETDRPRFLSSSARRFAARLSTSLPATPVGGVPVEVGFRSASAKVSASQIFMRRVGIEPTCPCEQWILNPSRIPVPPPPQDGKSMPIPVVRSARTKSFWRRFAELYPGFRLPGKA